MEQEYFPGDVFYLHKTNYRLVVLAFSEKERLYSYKIIKGGGVTPGFLVESAFNTLLDEQQAQLILDGNTKESPFMELIRIK